MTKYSSNNGHNPFVFEDSVLRPTPRLHLHYSTCTQIIDVVIEQSLPLGANLIIKRLPR